MLRVALFSLVWQTLATAKAQPQKKPAIGASATSVQVAQLQTKSIETSLSSAVTESTIKQVQQPTSAIVDDAMTIPPPTIQSEKEVKNVEVIPDCVCHDEHIEQDAEQPTADLSEPLTYVSPLDKRETNVSSNPLQMLCPYELFGVCKDASCTYNHCP